MKTTKFLTVAIVASASLSSYAAEIRQLPTLYALHINGIDTTEREARNNLRRLNETSQMTSTGKYLKWDLVYNPTSDDIKRGSVLRHGLQILDNLLDVALQKLTQAQLQQLNLDNYTQMYMLANNLNYPTNSPKYTRLKEQLKDHYAKILAAYGGSNSQNIMDNFHDAVPSQFASVLQLLNNGESVGKYDYTHNPNAVLLIPHSQGNLYANYLHKHITEIDNFDPQHVAVYGIATPASYTSGDLPYQDETYPTDELKMALSPVTSYTTSCSDLVIGCLAAKEQAERIMQPAIALFNGNFTLPPVLACNYTDSSESANLKNLGHNLTNYYLAEPKLKSQITKMINYYAYQLNVCMLRDLTANMIYGDNKYNLYPQTLTMVVGFNRDNQQSLINPANKQVICANDNCKKNVLRLKTPQLDYYAENFAPYPLAQFPGRLIHYAALPNENNINGYPINGLYYVAEQANNISKNSYPFLIYPTNHLNALSVYYGAQCKYSYTQKSNSSFGDPWEGNWKVFYPDNVTQVQECSQTFSELYFRDYLIDGKFQRVAS